MSYVSGIGIYVDVANIAMNGGYGMRYDVLREFACHDAAEAVRLNAYVAFDVERARDDPTYRQRTNNFYDTLRDLGYKVIQKNVKRYIDEEGKVFVKANSDLDMAVDALLQSTALNRVLLITGDGDFLQVVRALQNKGCRVEVVAFDNVSAELRREADVFMSGYLIPNLLPVKNSVEDWGRIYSRVRGCCYEYKHDRGFGFIRFLKNSKSHLWVTDTRHNDSPYETAYFHASNLDNSFDFNTNELPDRNIFFEFDLYKSTRTEGIEAKNIRMVGRL
ncbi:NYN domain-containing protein [Candidatus Magnetomoraceae bacterium gMMP-15]